MFGVVFPFVVVYCCELFGGILYGFKGFLGWFVRFSVCDFVCDSDMVFRCGVFGIKYGDFPLVCVFSIIYGLCREIVEILWKSCGKDVDRLCMGYVLIVYWLLQNVMKKL